MRVEIAKLPMAEGFAKVWSYKGLAIALDTPQIQFACDFANMLFTSFFEQQQKMAAAKMQAVEKEKEKTNSLIVEG